MPSRPAPPQVFEHQRQAQRGAARLAERRAHQPAGRLLPLLHLAGERHEVRPPPRPSGTMTGRGGAPGSAAGAISSSPQLVQRRGRPGRGAAARAEVERDRVRPDPAEARQESVVGVAHQLRQPVRLRPAPPRDGEARDVDRLRVLDAVPRDRAARRRPRARTRAPPVVVGVHAAEPAGQLVAHHQHTLRRGAAPAAARPSRSWRRLAQPRRLRLRRVSASAGGRGGALPSSAPPARPSSTPPCAPSPASIAACHSRSRSGKSAAIGARARAARACSTASAPGDLPPPLSPTTPHQRCGGSAQPGYACAQRALPISADAADSNGAAT